MTIKIFKYLSQQQQIKSCLSTSVEYEFIWLSRIRGNYCEQFKLKLLSMNLEKEEFFSNAMNINSDCDLNFGSYKKHKKSLSLSEIKVCDVKDIKEIKCIEWALQPSFNKSFNYVLCEYYNTIEMGLLNSYTNACQKKVTKIVNNILKSMNANALKMFFNRTRKSTKRSLCDPQKDGILSHGSEIDYGISFTSPQNITENTEFCLGSNANRLLGYCEARGRIYTKHPFLFIYKCDNDDKKDLIKANKIEKLTGRVFLVIYDDIKKLLNGHPNYKDNSQFNSSSTIKCFTLPPKMINKIKSNPFRLNLRRDSESVKSEEEKL